MAHKAFKPEYFKMMVKAAKSGPVSFALGLAEKGAKDVFVMSDDLAPKDLFAKVRSETGLTKGAYGRCRLEGTRLNLEAEKGCTGLRGRVTDLAKEEGWPFKQAAVSGEEEGGTRALVMEDEAAPAAAPSTAPAGAPGSAAPAPGLRRSEVIAGASSLQYSVGGLTDTVAAQGKDFGTGARENAGGNDTGDQGQVYIGGSAPMQSAKLGGGARFAKRYAVGFLCYDYDDSVGSDLKEIENYKKPQSAYLKAFKGMDESGQVANPTGKTLLETIPKWVDRLAGDLAPGETGELVVSFQGHGANGKIFGVDGKAVTPSQMAKMASDAEAKRVSVTFVLDACFTGTAVEVFQRQAAEDLQKRVDQAAGASGAAEAAKGQLDLARKLMKYCRALNTFGNRVHNNISGGKAAMKSGDQAESLLKAAKTKKEMITLLEAIRDLLRPEVDKPSAGVAGLADLSTRFDQAIKLSKSFQPATVEEYQNWTGEIGALEDRISDAVNRLLESVDGASRAGT